MQIQAEVLYIKHRIEFESTKDFYQALKSVDQLIELQNLIIKMPIAEKQKETSELAFYLFLKG
jgi:hypothetical protein